jgi:2-keto-4-pentenoate hydratase/2-oxohepta-3-ene-1,7-dioic acid hydratase in catechol pathway
MRLVSFVGANGASFGIARQDGVFDLGARLKPAVSTLKSFLELLAAGYDGGLPRASTTDYAHGEFQYAPVIPNPSKILCVGLNYDEHRKETGRAESAYPAIFTRFADTLVGHQMPIRLPTASRMLDYEGELAVVIGKPGYRVPAEQAMSIVAGYACFNDASLRDWQRHTHQFTPGKNFPGTGGFGPELVTADEIGPDTLAARAIQTRLNGAVMQSAHLGDMIFPVPQIIEYLSGFTPLAPGDVIATGTPGGVGFRRDPQVFMGVGDSIEVSIDGVGRLTNSIAPE